MSTIGHRRSDPVVRSEVYPLEPGHHIDAHVHDEHHQLIWASHGALSVVIGDRAWMLPPNLALWVPRGVTHALRATAASVFQGIYLDADRSPISWSTPTVVSITPLLRSLVQHLDREDVRGAVRERAESVLFDVVRPASASPLQVPWPRDPRARAVADALVAHPADSRGLEAWARRVNAGSRTLSRLFKSETGMTFSQWRTHVRLRASLERIAGGESVSTVARQVGYATPSAFVAAFRQTTGRTPGTYLSGD